MNEMAWQERISKRVWVLQVIVTALVVGCVFFLVVAILVPGPGAERAGEGRPLQITWVALAFLAVMLVARCVLPTIVVRKGRRQIARGTFSLLQTREAPLQGSREELEQMGDAGPLYMLYQTKTIIGAAMIEGITFFMLIAYLVERQVVALGIAVALILAIAAHMPTRAGVIHWIEDQLRFVEEERGLER
jgi:hypothetical protein